MPCGKGTSRNKADTLSVGADARHRPVRQPLSCGAMQVSPPAYNTAESLYVPAPSRRGPPHLLFLLSVVLVVLLVLVVLVVRFVVFCWVRLVVFWVERLVVLFV